MNEQMVKKYWGGTYQNLYEFSKLVYDYSVFN